MSTITVSSLAELNSALSGAQGGETILLEGGDYGALVMNSYVGPNPDFPSNVTIASADPSDPAIFTSVRVHDGSNLTFDGITFDYEFQTGDPIYENNFLFSGVDNLTIKNSVFDGDLAEGVSNIDDGFGYGQGVMIRFSNDVTFENNEVYEFHRGVAFSESSDLLVSGNDIHSLRMDGITFNEIDGVIIENNYIHDFRGSPKSDDHSDMIQFWTTSTDSPSKDITIRGNILDIGDGTPTQSIFLRNERVDLGQAGEELFYQNVSITDNIIINAHLHGITVGESNGLTIASNTVVHRDGQNIDGIDANVEIPRIGVANASKDVTIIQNATSAIEGFSQSGTWTVQDNALIQDQRPGEAGYYQDVFVTTALQQGDGAQQFIAAPDGLLTILNAGAAPTLSSNPIPGLVEPLSQTQPESLSDVVVETQSNESVPPSVQSPIVEATNVATTFAIPDSIDLENIGVAQRVDHDDVNSIPGADAFSISFSLKASAVQDFGEVFRMHGSIHVYVQPDGHLRVRATAENEQVTQISSNEALFSSQNTSSVSITLENGVLGLSVDGNPAATAPLSGGLGSLSNRDLVFGNPWDQDNYTGTVEDWQLTIPKEGAQTSKEISGIAGILESAFATPDADGMLPIYEPQVTSSGSSDVATSQNTKASLNRVDEDGLQFRSELIDKFDAHQYNAQGWSPDDT